MVFENAFLNPKVDWCDINNRDNTDGNFGELAVGGILLRISGRFFVSATAGGQYQQCRSRSSDQAAADIKFFHRVLLMESVNPRRSCEVGHNVMRISMYPSMIMLLNFQ